MLKIAVTGVIACGKSLIGSFLESMGLPVCDADKLVHRLQEPGKPVYNGILKEFGDGVLGRDGSLNRTVLGRRIFRNKFERASLNAIVHPEVRKAWNAWLGARKKSRAAVVLIPLFYETGEKKGEWDADICVAASDNTQLKRLAGKTGSVDEAKRRIRSQLPVKEKMALSDYVIVNDGTVESGREQVKRILRCIMEK